MNRSQLSDELMHRIEAACKRYADAWRSGSMPRLEDFLPLFRVEERPPLLTALQNLQQELFLGPTVISDADINSATEAMPAIKPNSVRIVYLQEFDENQPPIAKVSHFPVEKVSPPSVEKFIQPLVERASPPTIEQFSQPPAEEAHDGTSAYVSFKVIAGPHAGAGFTFKEHDTLFAGRLKKAQLRLEKDPHFSRHHFRLEVNPPTCFLMDLKSTNGTFVNGEEVNERFLCNGDIVSGGSTKMLVTIFDPAQSEDDDCAEATMAHPRANEKLTELISSVKPALTKESLVLAPTAADSFPIIPGYKILKRVGEGDLGIVYQAQKLESNEVCALKVLSPTAHNDENSIQTFLRGASVLKKLDHPHIIHSIEIGSADRTIFLAMEYTPSISWQSIVDHYPPDKRIRLACGLMGQILSALEYAHSRSFVHRDVKPSNILICKQDQKLVAKLTDFGLAKEYTSAGMSNVTRNGEVLGSLPFMSPDQFLNSRDARPTCDLYSAGATLYWMLTGREPIPLEGHACKFLAILEDLPTPIRQLNPAISEALAAAVHRSLAKTPEKRYASASEMRYQLKTALQ